jgi:hypothetical protein
MRLGKKGDNDQFSYSSDGHHEEDVGRLVSLLEDQGGAKIETFK